MYAKIINFLRIISAVGSVISFLYAMESLFTLTLTLWFVGFLFALVFFNLLWKQIEVNELKKHIIGYCKMATGYIKDNDELIEVLNEQDESAKVLKNTYNKEFQKHRATVIELDAERNKNNALRSAVHSKECTIKELEKENKKLKNENEELNKKITSDALYIKKLRSAFNRFSKLNKYDSPERHSASLGYMFSEIGWNNWQRSVHEKKEQIDRYHRAKNEPIKLLSYDDVEGKAIIKGTSGENYLVTKTSCSCPDFDNKQRHNGPCKHMYYLAMQLYNRQLTKGSET